MSTKTDEVQEDLQTEVKPVKQKPYTGAQIKELQAQGHIIGNPKTPLSAGHTDESISQWEKWTVEVFLKTETIDGKQKGVPYEIYAVKKLVDNMRGSAETFQAINKQVDFGLVSRPNYQVYMFPAGAIEVGKKYPCNYWIETKGRGVDESHHVRVRFIGIEEATGAPKQ